MLKLIVLFTISLVFFGGIEVARQIYSTPLLVTYANEARQGNVELDLFDMGRRYDILFDQVGFSFMHVLPIAGVQLFKKQKGFSSFFLAFIACAAGALFANVLLSNSWKESDLWIGGGCAMLGSFAIFLLFNLRNYDND
ncbi:hypothetical protein [Pacificibacter marinus]|uniref:hypothetical protein n=1 Tax=Pacificibacter marinus TaxID=658057 RepID=UPI001C07584C|nr:hypothetical protein [Pacificibacter marinus]MBU2868678.1 hypothetical protein [Pacificibacter marinus]